MKDKRGGCLAMRIGAFGDMLYALPTLEKLKQDYGYLHFDTGVQGGIMFSGNTTFDMISVFPTSSVSPQSLPEVVGARADAMASIGWDKIVSFWRCLEVSCIAEVHQEEFYWPRERRREKFGSKNFYDEHLVRAGYEPGSLTDCGTFEFNDKELEWINTYMGQHGDAFTVVISPCGSTAQKVPQGLEGVAETILDSWSNARIVIVGDREAQVFKHPKGTGRVLNLAGKVDYRISIAAVRCADFVIGPETSMLVAAGMFGIPKTMICTSANVEQCTKYHRNDFSIQSTASCSPCHRAIYQRYPDGRSSSHLCNFFETWLGDIPTCNVEFNTSEVLEGAIEAYELRNLRKRFDDYRSRRVGSLPTLRSLSTD